MKKCDTCKWLKVPDNAYHAKHYRICTVPVVLPANINFWDRSEIEGGAETVSLLRAITVKMAENPEQYLKECLLHEN